MCSYVLLSETLIVNKTTVFKCIKCVISDCYLFTFTGLAKSTVVYIVIVKYKKCWHTRTVNVHGVCPRNVLKYLSKEDEQVSFYCRESALSFNYRAGVGARRTPTFRFSDHFVLEYLQYYRVLQKLHSERVWRQCRVNAVIPRVQEWWS